MNYQELEVKLQQLLEQLREVQSIDIATSVKIYKEAQETLKKMEISLKELTQSVDGELQQNEER